MGSPSFNLFRTAVREGQAHRHWQTQTQTQIETQTQTQTQTWAETIFSALLASFPFGPCYLLAPFPPSCLSLSLCLSVCLSLSPPPLSPFLSLSPYLCPYLNPSSPLVSPCLCPLPLTVLLHLSTCSIFLSLLFRLAQSLHPLALLSRAAPKTLRACVCACVI